jgi:DNA polymerase V
MGLFGISEDYTENYLSLDEKFQRNRHSTYFFETEGEGMEPTIVKKDILIVDRSKELTSGNIGVISIHGEHIVRRFIKKENQIILRGDNTKYKDIFVTAEMEMMVFGPVTGIAREF